MYNFFKSYFFFFNCNINAVLAASERFTNGVYDGILLFNNTEKYTYVKYKKVLKFLNKNYN